MGLYFWQVATAEEIAEFEKRRKEATEARERRSEFIHSRCSLDLPEPWLDVIKVGACGFQQHETALVLGMPDSNVANIERQIVEWIFEPWEHREKEMRSIDTAEPDEDIESRVISFWFYSHKECCMAEHHAAMESDQYSLADERGIEQPADRIRMIANHHIDFSAPEWQKFFNKPYCDIPSQRLHRPCRGGREPRGS
jgi:hypothetical protein